MRAGVLKGPSAAQLPTVMADQLRWQGRLQRVFKPWLPASAPIFAVYPSSGYLTAKVRAFVELAVLGSSGAAPAEGGAGGRRDGKGQA